MPLAQVKRKERITDKNLRDICDKLPGLIAAALHCETDPSGALTQKDVEIWYHPRNKFDRLNNFDLQIVLQANAIPERMANLGARLQKLAQGIAQLLPTGLKGFVWMPSDIKSVEPNIGSFVEFEGKKS